MRGYLLVIMVIGGMLQHAMAQPPLSKRLQKEKAEFEALIERERIYDSLSTAADQAFKAGDFLLARMTYEEAIPYNEEKAQWLQSKVNDLDILMAKNAAREVDSILVALTPKESGLIQQEERPSILEDRSMEEPLPMPEPEIADKKEESPAEPAVPKPPQEVKAEPIQTPEVAKRPEPKPEQVKVKEDFSKFDDGISEETFNLENHEVLRVVVKEGIDVMVFKKVKHNWGGEFYFLDDVATTKRYWIEQVEQYRHKYGEAGK